MNIHILGISGTFMAGLALLAKAAGHFVSGSDIHCYPPMSTQLKEQGILLYEGYAAEHIAPDVDCVIVGNVIKRGNAALEYVMANGIPYTSGPAWLAQHILHDRWVLAVAGTHGKTTTTSLLAWILEQAGLSPGFLIGGIAQNFGISARLGASPYFVVEADEYDSAFFDKRPKFIHYRAKTAILNNLEFDHADIYPDLEAIKLQFHYLVRTIPNNGLIVVNGQDEHLASVLAKGTYSPQTSFGQGDWTARLIQKDGSEFAVSLRGKEIGTVHWHLLGQHNVNNALGALAAASHLNIDMEKALSALFSFKNVKRRLELKTKLNDISVFDDFAHHPTAIATTLAGLRANIGPVKRILAVLEFGSYTMRHGIHQDKIGNALLDADLVFCKRPEVAWGLEEALQNCGKPVSLHEDVDQLLDHLMPQLQPGDQVLVMSNGGFNNIHEKLLTRLAARGQDGPSS